MKRKKVLPVKLKEDNLPKPRFALVVSGEIDEEMYNSVLSRMNEYIINKEAFSGITIIITSLGGAAYIGLAIYDFIKSLNADVWTVALGGCASAATLIFALGNKRLVSENASFLIHSARIEYSDMVTMREINHLSDTIQITNRKMIKILSETIGNEEFKERLQDTFKTVKEDYISVEDLLKYGVATEILTDFESILY